MTSLNRLKSITENGLPSKQELTIAQVREQLLLAKKASTLGKQFTAILNIVNRYPSGAIPADIHTDLLEYEHILQLIKTINKMYINEIPGESGVNTLEDEEKLKSLYQIAVNTFNN